MSLPGLLVFVVLLAVLVWAALRLAGGYGRGDPALTLLSTREQAVVRAASDAVFPPDGPLALSGTEAGIPAHVDRYLAVLNPRNRLLIRLLFCFVEHATLLFPAPGAGGFRRFSALPLEQRMAVLEGFARSRLLPRRLVFQSLRTVLTMGYFASPAVLRAIRLAPLALETPVVDADLLYPPVGLPRSAIRFSVGDRDRVPTGGPLDPHGPLHASYAEPAEDAHPTGRAESRP